MNQSERDQMITSKEVLEKTGISRATLNNYIKMGILPKPVVRKPQSDLGGIRQIGYFPETVLDKIDAVQQYKRQGYTMGEIAGQLAETSTVVDLEPKEPEIPIENAASQSPPITQLPLLDIPEKLTLTLTDPGVPAILANHHFEIEWINSQAEKYIFNQSISTMGKGESRNIFKLFFSWEFNSKFQNWQQIIAHHLSYAKKDFTKHQIHELYSGLSSSEIEFLQSLYDDSPQYTAERATSVPLDFVSKAGEVITYHIHNLFFQEGILLIYIPVEKASHEDVGTQSQRAAAIDKLLNQRIPGPVSYCVLVTRLQDAPRIKAELLPNEYYNLINQLWKILQDSVDHYNGIYGKQVGNGRAYYFFKDADSHYMVNVFNCALDIKAKMSGFSHEWQLRNSWLDDFYINMGISEGQEVLGVVHSSDPMELSDPGNAIHYASSLSAFSRQGAIWTTKNLISRLDPEDMARLQFGVYRIYRDRNEFFENSFCRINDFPGEEDRETGRSLDISLVPVTEILGKKPKITGEDNSEKGA